MSSSQILSWDKLLNDRRLKSSSRDKTGDPRNEFDSDFGRVIFSPAIRRMHDKTQVFPLTTDDNIHSRLTHSMEVMSLGYSLGLGIAENEQFLKMTGLTTEKAYRTLPVILKSVCLVHDIGNPPFGHFGETVIKTYFQGYFAKSPTSLTDVQKEDFTSFDGNAQGFRVLTKLQVLDNAYGLNLTYATLAAYLKYPNSGEINKSFLTLSKRGVFQSEKEYLNSVAEHCGLVKGLLFKRHPLAFLMEAADSICYLIMDIEDGFNKGWYGFDELKECLKDVTSLKTFFSTRLIAPGLRGSEITNMVNLRIEIIRQLVEHARNTFLDNFEAIYEGDYGEELILTSGLEISRNLKQFCIDKIFPKNEVQSLELTGHSVLTGLLDYYTHFVFHGNSDYRKRVKGLISQSITRAALIENVLPLKADLYDLDEYYKLRVIVDFISGMTDQFALNHYQKLSGQRIT